MKIPTRRLSVVAALIILGVSPAFAHPGGHALENSAHDKPVKPSVSAEKLPESVADILQTIDAQHVLLKTALAEGKLSVVQANALTINALVQHIVTKVPADHVAGVKELAARHAQLTADIVKSSSAGAKKETDANASKLSSNIRALKAQAH